MSSINNRYWGGVASLLDNPALLGDVSALNQSEIGYLNSCIDTSFVHLTSMLGVFGRMAGDYGRLPSKQRFIDDSEVLGAISALNAEISGLMLLLSELKSDLSERASVLKGGSDE